MTMTSLKLNYGAMIKVVFMGHCFSCLIGESSSFPTGQCVTPSHKIFQQVILGVQMCCGQLWVRHMICGQTCDELYHFTFYLIVLGYL